MSAALKLHPARTFGLSIISALVLSASPAFAVPTELAMAERYYMRHKLTASKPAAPEPVFDGEWVREERFAGGQCVGGQITTAVSSSCVDKLTNQPLSRASCSPASVPPTVRTHACTIAYTWLTFQKAATFDNLVPHVRSSPYRFPEKPTTAGKNAHALAFCTANQMAIVGPAYCLASPVRINATGEHVYTVGIGPTNAGEWVDDPVRVTHPTPIINTVAYVATRKMEIMVACTADQSGRTGPLNSGITVSSTGLSTTYLCTR